MRRRTESFVTIGITGGLSLQNMTGKNYWGEKLENKFIAGYKAGVHVNIPSAPDLYIQPGLGLFAKGAKQDIMGDNITKTTRLLYLETPLNFLYRPKMRNGHLLLAIGPYASFGMVGKEIVKSADGTTTLPVRFIRNAYDEPTTYAYFRGLDLGLNISGGYEFYKGFSVQIFGQFGFIKTNSDYDLPNDKTVKRNLGFGIITGYRFKR